MVEQAADSKPVIIHVGPHKTGSTAIQQCLAANHDLLADGGILFLHDRTTHDAALSLARGEFDRAGAQLRAISAAISGARAEAVILSHEDFCGDLPGRSRGKAIYPRLARNLKVIARELRPHRVSFVFFERDESDWLRSCYHQHLKHRTQFSSLGEFRAHYDPDLSWSRKIEEARTVAGNRFYVIPYSMTPDTGVRALLAIAGRPNLPLSRQPTRMNASPAPEKIRLLERINAFTGFKGTAWFAKSLVLNDWSPSPPANLSEPPTTATSELARMALPDLTRRAAGRFRMQDIEDILPDRAVKLSDYLFAAIPADIRRPYVTRMDINNQSLILDYNLQGKSHLAKLNALTISYLRRRTVHTGKARHLFHRIWREHGHVLINEVATRWLISTLQTFLDHGENEAQRMIGASGYFYANMMKIYEGERAIEGRDQDATYEQAIPRTANRFTGLDRYAVGGTDLLVNTNALALDLAARDDVAGLVLLELLLRVEASANVFTRMDRTRQEKGIEVTGFADTWSFFKPP